MTSPLPPQCPSFVRYGIQCKLPMYHAGDCYHEESRFVPQYMEEMPKMEDKTKFFIWKNIPFTSRSRYPFAEMEIGDSFVAPKKTQTRIWSLTQHLYPKKFASRKIDAEHVRIWRIK